MGVKSSRFLGCKTIGDETKPIQEYKENTDEHGDEVGRMQIDKTVAIQNFIDFIEWYEPHPSYQKDETKRRPRLMIPFKNEFETEWLIKDFTAITRKDLQETEDVAATDPRQKPRKEFNHPRDSVMSIIYCLVADQQEEPDFRIYPVRRRF